MRHDSAAYTARQGRRFALTLAIAFAALAAFARWRGAAGLSGALASVAGMLLALGLVVPAQLGALERAWMTLARAISRVTTPLFMGIVYFLVLTPAGVIRRTLGPNPLVHREGVDGYWIRRSPITDDAARRRMERQF